MIDKAFKNETRPLRRYKHYKKTNRLKTVKHDETTLHAYNKHSDVNEYKQFSKRLTQTFTPCNVMEST